MINKKEYSRKYYQKNKKKIKEYDKNWRKNNKGYDKKWYQENKDRILKRIKKYNQTHKEEIKEYYKKYCQKNREKIKDRIKKWKKKKRYYNHYVSAKRRCNNPKGKDYKYYGEKGIKMLMTLEDFKYLWFRDKAYLLKKPSIDRIDNDGNYILKNCRFIEMIDNSKKGGK